MAAYARITSAARRWKGPLLGFAVGQPALQIVNLLTGLLLLRWMSVEHYAQFGVAFAFQSTVAMLADLGFSSSILALAGDRAKDPEILGKYVRSARHFRFILVCVVGLVFALCFPWLTAKHDWGAAAKVSILASILCAVSVQGWSMYQAPLLGYRLIARLYQPQIAAGGLRLALSGLLHVSQSLTGVAASWLGTLALGISGWWIKRRASDLVKEPTKSDPAANREMLRYLAPLMPGVIFTALQTQISMGIITVLGTTQNIAEVAALGRLGQVFGILSAFNGVIIGPYFASLPINTLVIRYLQVFSLAVILAAIISVFAFLSPTPFLWLLGQKYVNLKEAVGWVILSSCISYVGGVMWSIHAARKWVYWWATILYISLVVCAQILGAMLLDLKTTIGVMHFGVISATSVLAAQAMIAAVGLISTRRN